MLLRHCHIARQRLNAAAAKKTSRWAHRGAATASTCPPQRVAVIGGGFAGLAVSWHLLAAARAAGTPMQLQLLDAYGLGAGGSGASAGLLHPYTARGKILWRGLEAFREATALLAAAEAAVAAAGAAEVRAAGIQPQFAWRHGMLRTARSAKQAADIARFLKADPAAATATRAVEMSDAAALAALVPGLDPDLLMPAEHPAAVSAARSASGQSHQRKQQHRKQHPSREQPVGQPALGLMVHEGMTIHPASYMAALWMACKQAAEQAGTGSSATLSRQAVPSLAVFQAAQGPFDAIVVAAGAAMESIEELKGALPLDLCHGHSLDMQPATGSSQSGNCNGVSGHSSDSYPAGAPSLLGSPYIAAHGSDRLVIGATKRYGLTAAQAFDQCSKPLEEDPDAAAAAADALVPAAAQLWPPLNGWKVEAVRAGVRALPARSPQGSVPYAGRLDLGMAGSCEHRGPGEGQQGLQPSCWVIGGLGARGLLYHAWMGKLVAEAVMAGSEGGLPTELLRWKQGAVTDVGGV